ncbi:MAG: hypothetical protein SF187_30085 [Deltaproteobacteria bacterium]|nr:hypothetical protein [Deltaproteobacteria bacterium]
MSTESLITSEPVRSLLTKKMAPPPSLAVLSWMAVPHNGMPFGMLLHALGFAVVLVACVSVPPTPPSHVVEGSAPAAIEGELPSGPRDNQNWSDVGQEEGRVEMASQGELFLVATQTGLHLFEGQGCEHTQQGALVRLSQFAEACTHNRLFDPSTHETCAVLCRPLVTPDSRSVSPRTGALLAYAGRQGQYLVVQTFNGFRVFERQLSCKDEVPLGVDVEFESSPEGCIATAIRPPGSFGGTTCGLWCR